MHFAFGVCFVPAVFCRWLGIVELHKASRVNTSLLDWNVPLNDLEKILKHATPHKVRKNTNYTSFIGKFKHCPHLLAYNSFDTYFAICAY